MFVVPRCWYNKGEHFIMELPTTIDGSSRFLVDFRAVNAKTDPLCCTLPSLDEIMDQVAEEKPQIYI